MDLRTEPKIIKQVSLDADRFSAELKALGVPLALSVLYFQ